MDASTFACTFLHSLVSKWPRFVFIHMFWGAAHFGCPWSLPLAYIAYHVFILKGFERGHRTNCFAQACVNTFLTDGVPQFGVDR